MLMYAKHTLDEGQDIALLPYSLENLIRKKLVNTPLPTLRTSFGKTYLFGDVIQSLFWKRMDTTTDSGQQEAHLLQLLFDRTISSEEVFLDTSTVIGHL